MLEQPFLLAVDDDPLARRLLEATLQKAGFEATSVGSGEEALAVLDRCVPAMVLLDLRMPPPDGFDILRSLRSRPATADVPVLVVSGFEGEEVVARAFEAGADDFLRKPYRPRELVARVASMLRLRGYVDDLARRERDLNVVLELTQALTSSLDLREILQMVAQRLAEVTRVDRCSIVVTHEGDRVGYVVAASDDQQVRDLPLDLERYPEIREALRTGEPLVIDDVAHHPISEVLRREAPGQATYSSLAILPLMIERRPLGVLFLRSWQPVPLGGHVLSLARTIANTTAIALRNARLLEGLRAQNHQMSRAQEEAQARLARSERYAHFFESAADGIAVFDANGRMLFANPRALALVGASGQSIDKVNLRDFLLEDDRSIIDKLREGFRLGVYPHGVDMRLRRADGPIITTNVNFSAPRGEGVVLATFRDVTVDRAIEQELRKTKSFLESVIESSAEGIICADLRGNVLLFNRAAERCLGYDAAEILGKRNVEDMYPPGLARQIMRLVRQRGGRLEGQRSELLTKSGERVPILLSAALVHEGGRVTGSVGVFSDLRERIHMESRLVAAQEELKLREKQSIVAELAGTAAHELNQPLTSVMGYAELLKRRLDRDSPAFATAEVILGEAQRMAEIIRKIGTITRYETKAYVGQAKILDLDRASRDADQETLPPPSPTLPPSPLSPPSAPPPGSSPPPGSRRVP